MLGGHWPNDCPSFIIRRILLANWIAPRKLPCEPNTHWLFLMKKKIGGKSGGFRSMQFRIFFITLKLYPIYPQFIHCLVKKNYGRVMKSDLYIECRNWHTVCPWETVSKGNGSGQNVSPIIRAYRNVHAFKFDCSPSVIKAVNPPWTFN